MLCCVGCAELGGVGDHHGLESMKITQKTVLIQNRALDEYREVPIVTVNLFTCTGEHQSMCGGEGCLD